MTRRARLRPLVLAIALLPAAAPASAQQVLAARTLRAGTVISASDLSWPAVNMAANGDANGAADGAADRAAIRERAAGLIGLETRRVVYAGRPIDEADLGPPVLVRRNSVVTMTYRDRGLGIRAEGRALDSGGDGESVRVINLGSRQQIAATVIGPDTVEVRR